MKLSVAVLLLVVAATNGGRLSLNKGVIVHLFEWRWEDIAQECEEFLAPNGFAGVQISPPNENLIVWDSNRPWWERYQPVSYILQTRSGSENELKDMLRRCNNVGIRVFADVVFNHMTGDSNNCKGTAGSSCNTGSLQFPIYSRNDFHYPECDINNYNDANNVRNCKLTGLHDLNQGSSYVRSQIVGFLNKLISYGMAGFRVDAAKHMWPADLQYIFGQLSNLNTNFGFPSNTQALIFQEVNDPGNEAVKYYEYTSWGLVTDFRLGNELGRCFQGNNPLHWLVNFGSAWNLLPEDQTIVFIDNHDTERDAGNVVTYKSHQQYKMAIAFMLAWGYSQPRILSSFAFDQRDQGPPHDSSYNILSPRPITNNVCSNGWNCQHRWRQIFGMVKFHNTVSGTSVTNWWSNNNNQIAFGKGNKGFIAFNLEGNSFNQNLQTGLPQGTYCDVISGTLENGSCTGKTVNVGSNGYAQIYIDSFSTAGSDNDGVLAIHIGAKR